MTVASEISRLQCAKADIRQAIIDKWVSVWANLTLDDYAACISDIPTWPTIRYADILAVWWWGWAGWWWAASWWWAGGWVKLEYHMQLIEDSYCIKVWAWWGWQSHWCPTCIGDIICAPWWHLWGFWQWTTNYEPWYAGSWWNITGYTGSIYWNKWWDRYWENGWWWGWWAWWPWCNWSYRKWGDWWLWVTLDISWSNEIYWAGWAWTWEWWGGTTLSWCWRWWTSSYWGWVSGVAIIRYKTDWSDCINCATWWCKYVCWDYTSHCFTSDWTFTIVS